MSISAIGTALFLALAVWRRYANAITEGDFYQLKDREISYLEEANDDAKKVTLDFRFLLLNTSHRNFYVSYVALACIYVGLR